VDRLDQPDRVNAEPALAVLDAHAALDPDEKVADAPPDPALSGVVGRPVVAVADDQRGGVLSRGLEEVRDLLRVKLTVGVDRHRVRVSRVAARAERAAKGRGFAAIPFMREDDYVRIPRRPFTQQLRGRVGRAVVDDDDRQGGHGRADAV
jgi:hypothetical protein